MFLYYWFPNKRCWNCINLFEKHPYKALNFHKAIECFLYNLYLDFIAKEIKIGSSEKLREKRFTVSLKSFFFIAAEKNTFLLPHFFIV